MQIINNIMGMGVIGLMTLNCSGQIAQKTSWHFSPSFIAQYKPDQNFNPPSYLFPELKIPVQCAAQEESTLFSYENISRLINIITIVYATIKMYERYQVIGTASPPNENDYQWILFIKKAIVWLCPDMLQSAGMYSSFLIDSTTIVFKALVYKTIARLLLLCAEGDLSDLMKAIAQKSLQTLQLFL